MILHGSDSSDYHKTHHNIYRDVSVSYSSLSDQGLHTNGADHKNKIYVIPKKILREKFRVRNMKIQSITFLFLQRQQKYFHPLSCQWNSRL